MWPDRAMAWGPPESSRDQSLELDFSWDVHADHGGFFMGPNGILLDFTLIDTTGLIGS